MGRMACTEPQCLYRGALYLYFFMQLFHGGRGSVVGIEIRYWLDGPGFETLSTLGTYWTYSGHPLLLVDFIY